MYRPVYTNVWGKVLFIVLLLLLCSALPIAAQSGFDHTITYLKAENSEPLEHPLDIQRMKVDVSFDPYAGLVRGIVVHSFSVLQQQVDSVTFHAVNITIKQALLNDKPVRFRRTDSVVVVYCEPALHWDTQGTIQFTYEATPRRGIYFIGWADSTGTMRRQIWTQGQATDNRHWIPMYDEMNDKMITETVVTFDSAYTVISNGNLLSKRTNGDGSRTWHYAMPKPHSSYLLMLAIGKYAVTYDTSSGKVPLEQYWYPDRPQDYEPTYRLSKEGMDFLEQEIGMPYQWGIYKQIPAADYVFGAMENTTATIFGDFYLCDARGWLDRSYVGTNTHELTHQWFGDLVTGRSIQSLWLQESFATFYPLLFAKHISGADEYQWQRRGMQNSALSAGERDRYPIVHPKAGGARVYPKGAVVLDMMRTVFGRDQQRRAILHYLKQHAFGNVETNDLYLSFQDTLGISPRWFFDQWLYRSGEPHYVVTYGSGTQNDLKGTQGVTTLTIKQVQFTDDLTGYFRMPIVCEVHYTDRTKDSVTAWVDGQTTVVDVPNPDSKDIAFILFDPGSTVLKRVTFVKPWEMLHAQATQAPFMIDRYDALVELAKDSMHAAELDDLLQSIMKKEKHQGMRSEAVSIALGKNGKGLEHSRDVVLAGLRDKSADVRKRTLSAITTIDKELQEPVETLLKDSSYTVIEQVFRKLCAAFPDRVKHYLDQTSDVKSPHALVEIARAEIQAVSGDSRGMQGLAEYCTNRHEFGVRRNAFGALVRVGTASTQALSGMIDATANPNWRLADSAADALSKLATQTRIRQEVRSLLRTIDPDEKRYTRVADMVR